MTIPDYDINSVISTLASINAAYPEGSKEREAIERAQIALLYVRHLRKVEELDRYYREFFDPDFKVVIAREFVTREEADAWLASAEATEAMLVKIAGRGFQVAQLPGGRRLFIDAPSLEELEKGR